MTPAVWVNSKTGEKISGKYQYNWAADRFYIILDSIDPITGEQRTIWTGNDHPEWGDWKRHEESIGKK